MIKYSISQDLYTDKYCATLLGGEFDNCHGYGSTEEEAIVSLKMTIRIRRK